MKSILLLAAVSLAGCAMVRSKNTDPWIGQPVEALDKHALFRTLPMVRTFNSAGVEVRNYQNRANTYQCYTDGNVRAGEALSYSAYSATLACTSRSNGCDYTFSIRDGRVQEYAPSGRMLDERFCAAAAATAGAADTAQPQK